MKNNTQKLKTLLQQAIRECPQDFTLSEARFHLNAALTKVEQVEKKREIRHEQEQRQLVVGQHTMESLHYIDDLIANEQRKIQEIAERRKKQQQPSTEEGDDDVSAILG